MLHKETVEESTLDLIHRVMADENLKDFKRVGGTALALMIGHRISVDIDLFTEYPFDAEKTGTMLSEKYKVDNLEIDNNTVNCFIDDIKVDCIAHRYPWIGATVELEGIRMASMEDIAAMKFNAIVQDGSRFKDFVDIYVLLEHRSLSELLNSYEQKYPGVSIVTAGKALIYHNDVRLTQQLGLLNKSIDWPSIVKRLRDATINPQKIFKPEIKLILKKTKAKTIKRSRGRGLGL